MCPKQIPPVASLQVGPLAVARRDPPHRLRRVGATRGCRRARRSWPSTAPPSTTAADIERTGVDADLMASLPNLGAVINFGVGYDTTDVAEAAARDILVSNTPDVLSDCVADTAVGLLIDTMRQFTASGPLPTGGPLGDRRQLPTDPQGFGIPHRRHRARPHRAGDRRAAGRIPVARSATYNRREVPDSPYTYVASAVELARQVDVLIIAAAGGGGTRHLVDREVLAALGPDGYLVNIAQGSVVDEHALVDALTGGRLAGAGLDVFTDEPNVPEALLSLDNVVLLPRRQRDGGDAGRHGGADLGQSGQVPRIRRADHAGAHARSGDPVVGLLTREINAAVCRYLRRTTISSIS